MPPILDVAIGVVFVFLLFSLVVSALNELILSYLDRRARFLKEGITELFRDSGGKPSITPDAFFTQGIIVGLSRGKYVVTVGNGSDSPKEKKAAASTAGVPSYIPGKSFVLALLGLVTGGKQLTDVQDMRKAIEDIGNKELKETLLSLYDDAKGNLVYFKANIENWFNESMDRVGGWYKRYAQQWLLVLSLSLAVICNVDSVRIIRALSMDPKLRESIVRQAEAYSAQASGQQTKDGPKLESKPPSDAAAESPGTAAVAQSSANPSPSPAPAADSQAKLETFKTSLADLGVTGVPMGWNDGPSQQLLASLPAFRNWFSCTFWSDNFTIEKVLSAMTLWLGAIIGWGVTGLAASLGAPFWFDLLNRFIDIRGVGRAPEESDTTAPKKPSTGVESYVVTGDSLKSMGVEGAQATQQSGLAPQAGQQSGVAKPQTQTKSVDPPSS